MDEANTKNEMSVELAIRRELAYRHKVAGLGLHSENHSQDFLPLQVPSSSYQGKTSNPTSKPFPSKNLLEFSQPLPNRPQNLIPKPLGPKNPIPKPIHIWTPSSNPWPNISGTMRKEITNGFQEGYSYVTTTTEGYSYCNICKVPCSSHLNLQQHLKGHQHMNKLQLLNRSKNGVCSPFCEICQIYCSDEDGLEMHYKGQKHRSKLREVELGGERKDYRTCGLCKIWCMDEDAYMQHLRGKNHKARVYNAEYEK